MGRCLLSTDYMSELQERLDKIHVDFESTQPESVLDIMHRATDDLIASGAHEKAAGTGDEMAEFQLEDTQGNLVSSTDYIGKKPLIMNFFRGFW